MSHPTLQAGNTAVITGAASGIGLACAQRFAALGMSVCLADLGPERLERAAQDIIALVPDAQPRLLTVETDVRKREDLERLESLVTTRFGGIDLLMNNAAVSGRGDVLGSHDYWQDTLATNLWGVIHGTQVFVPNMIARGRPGVVINTGSKQGITTPPGNPAYNVAKAGVKAFTEALQHQLRNTAECRIDAHLLIPGSVFTGLSQNPYGPKPAGAWTPQQLVEFMMDALSKGDFYILCPDNDVTRELDEKRILWAARDIVENRPPLSRWHPDYQEAFKNFIADPPPK
jgi:NAD(P)-dependent dehydrogenase (short-subunit alcohol dehydrogenase family)